MLIVTRAGRFNCEVDYCGGFRGMGGAPYIFRLDDGTIIESRNTWQVFRELVELVGDRTPITDEDGQPHYGRLLCADWRFNRVFGTPPQPTGRAAETFPHQRLGDRNEVEIQRLREERELDEILNRVTVWCYDCGNLWSGDQRSNRWDDSTLCWVGWCDACEGEFETRREAASMGMTYEEYVGEGGCDEEDA